MNTIDLADLALDMVCEGEATDIAIRRAANQLGIDLSPSMMESIYHSIESQLGDLTMLAYGEQI